MESIVEIMERNGNIKNSGFSNKKYLKEMLLARSLHSANYRPLTASERWEVTSEIRTSVRRCYKVLSRPEMPLYVFVHPWHSEEYKAFEGLTGYTPYLRVIHLFVMPGAYTQRSVRETFVHEYNHVVFFHYHGVDITLIQDMIMEGLAENFREEIVEGRPAPFSRALTRKEAFKKLHSLEPHFKSKSLHLIQSVQFGGGEYKRWTGYSVGYWLVREFRKRHKEMPWEELMQVKAEEMIGEIKKKGA